MPLVYRDLHALDDLRQVTELERIVWGDGYDDLVPASLMVVQVKCGAIVIGAFDGDRMVGFVYGFPGERHGSRLQWSHMLGVIPDFRRGRVGYQLKLEQRERSLAQSLDLVEWTYDPLQALNAQFNFGKLGVVVGEYLVDAYGASQSHLHRGAPTDRFVAQWWLRSPRVRATVESGSLRGHVNPDGPSDEARAAAPVLNPRRWVGQTCRCDMPAAFPSQADVVAVTIPPDFTAMLAEAPDLALDWRLKTRAAFEEAFARGYRVVDFRPESAQGGVYFLTLA